MMKTVRQHVNGLSRAASMLALLIAIAALGVSVTLSAIGDEPSDADSGHKRPEALRDEDGDRVIATPTPTPPPGGKGSLVTLRAEMQQAAQSRGLNPAVADAVIDAFLSARPAIVADLIEWQTAPCVTGGRSYPECSPADPGGTPTEFTQDAVVTVPYGFSRWRVTAALEAALAKPPVGVSVAGGSDGRYLVVLSLAGTVDLSSVKGYSTRATFMTVLIDIGGKRPIAGLSLGETAPLSMYRLFDPGLDQAIVIDGTALALENEAEQRSRATSP